MIRIDRRTFYRIMKCRTTGGKIFPAISQHKNLRLTCAQKKHRINNNLPAGDSHEKDDSDPAPRAGE